MNDDVDKILDMTNRRRAKYLMKMRRSSKGIVARGPKRFSNSKRDHLPDGPELITFIVKNGIKTASDLHEKRTHGDPNLSDCNRLFGSWSKTKVAAYGAEVKDIVPDDAEYVLKTVIQLELWTMEKYVEARRLKPEVVPPVDAVKKHWGGYKNLMALVIRTALKPFLERYLEICKKHGRIATPSECARENLPLDCAVSHFGSKELMDRDLFSAVIPRKSKSKRKGIQAKKGNRRRVWKNKPMPE
jgi:hypothetical protein